MVKQIESEGNLVILHGDEMAQVAFDAILERFVKKHVDITLHEIDLSAKNRLRTNGRIVSEAVDVLNAYGVGLKNAGITVNKAQLEQFAKEIEKEDGVTIDIKSLDKLATKSPNGTIRKGISGNITREDIPFTNLQRNLPDWKGRDIEVMTMDDGGLKGSFNRECQFSGILKLSFIDDKGHLEVLHTRPISRGDIYLIATNSNKKVKIWAEEFFQRALDEKRDAYVGLKDTVMPGYDGVLREVVEGVYKAKFEKKFKAKKLKYIYGLIDAQAAMMVAFPPERALWGIPDNTSGRKMLKLVNSLKMYGIPQREHQVAISRMSAGGGDQYGSFNSPAKTDGIITLTIGQRILHSRELKKGDPMLLMTNHPEHIRDWVRQCFEDAAKKDQEIYFGLKREYMFYDAVISDIINEVRDELAVDGQTPPPVMMMTPSKQLRKMICDPPRNARYAALNMDGDIFSDITAALGGSLATASSIIASPSGTMLFEAPHGTAPDLYEMYLKSKGKKSFFNPSALLYAVANALEVVSEREPNKELKQYSDDLKQALINTVAAGFVTPDIKGKTTNPKKEKVLDLPTFLDKVDKELIKLRK